MQHRRAFVFAALALATVLLVAAPASAGLTTFRQFTGNVGLSTDGFGSLSNSGTISADVPVGATVLAAYLYTATFTFGGAVVPTSTLNGTGVAYGPTVSNGTACCGIASNRADVTAIVAPVINGGPGGVYNFAVTEGSANQDGEALVVVYNLPSLGVSTVGILDGWASVTGDVATLTFGTPLDPTAPGFFADMRLGIGFSCCGQESTVNVNGTTITTHAGNFDDGTAASNGTLITVGGYDDPYSPFLPSYAADHERYDLKPYIALGDTKITVRTSNASQDDNIFLSTFWVSGEATVTGVPEPGSTIVLLGLGLIGIAGRRLAGRRSRT
jgi:hypothetical protein